MANGTVKHTRWGDGWKQAIEAAFPPTATGKKEVTVLRIQGRSFDATVIDERWSTYKVITMLPRFPAAQEERFMDALRRNPELSLALRHHTQPEKALDFAQANGLALYFAPGTKLSVQCSCGSRGYVCPHAHAALLALGDRIDKEPFLLFSIRGMNIVTIAEQCSMAGWEKELAFSTEAQPEIPPVASLFKYSGIRIAAQTLAATGVPSKAIPDVTEILPEAIVPNAAFDEAFKEKYKAALQAARDPESAPGTPLNLSEACSVQYAGFANWTVKGYIAFNDAMDFIGNVSAEELGKASPQIRALRDARDTALELVRAGAVYPKLFLTEENHVAVLWMSAAFIPQVAERIAKLQATLPANLMRSSGNTDTARISNAGEILLCATVTYFMRKVGNAEGLPRLFSVIFGDAAMDFNKGDTESTVREMQNLFAVYGVSQGECVPAFTVSEVTGNLSLDVDLERTASGSRFSLSKIWTAAFPQKERERTLQQISPFKAILPGFADYIQQKAIDCLHIPQAETSRFLSVTVPLLKALGISVALPKAFEEIIRGVPRPRITRIPHGISTGFCRLENLLRFDWEIAIGNDTISAEEFSRLSANAQGLLRYKERYFYVTVEDAARLKHGLRERQKLSPLHLLQIALAREFDGFSVDVAPAALEEIHKLRGESDADISVPPQIRASLRPYQKRGFAWMLRNAQLGFGSIIADDMGLGKTLQVISLLQQMKNDGAFTERKGIVIVPSGLIRNWENELSRFAPEIVPRVFHGSARDIEGDAFDIVLTTYGTLRTNADKFRSREWEIAVIDEAQNIKNPGTAQSKAARALPAHIKIAMSGTPVENRLLEFWSIMEFCNKGFFGTEKEFQATFERPIQNNDNRHRAELFKKVTAPFLLRRLKTDKSILPDLPEKLEQNEWAELSPSQAALYKEALDKAMNTLGAFEATEPQQLFKRSAIVLQLILALKQICNHPAQYLKNGKTSPELSGKMELFLDIAGAVLDTDEKMLIFTQFVEMGEILQRTITDKLKTQALFYHGGESLTERNAIIEKFQGDPQNRILILSLKAGGTGLNLTAASQVIHYDLWWNPAVEAQATDRAYRIGQNRNVVVHRLITKNTFEEKINALIESKKALTELTVATGESWITKLSDNELREIFTLGKS